MGCGRLGFERLQVSEGEGGTGRDAATADAAYAGGATDAGAAMDAGVAMDAGTDAGVAMDAGTDAGVAMDAGTDAGVAMDAGTDAGVAMDAGTDAGVAMDAGTDAGVAMDAGTDAGSGVCLSGGCPWACRAGVCDDTVQVALAGHSACALLASGRVACWGDNAYGQLGDGTFTASPTPVYVQGLVDAVEISAKSFHVCALRAGGSVVCWGDNSFADLGDGTETNRSAPVATTGIVGTVTHVIVSDDHSCALTGPGEVWCWGTNYWGQLGIDSTNTGNFATAQHLTTLASVPFVGAGFWHNCVVTDATGHLACWGRNQAGQLGDGTMTNAIVPVAVPGSSGVVQVEGGYNYTCALLDTGAVSCWGGNDQYQLGDESSTANQLSPRTIPGLTLTSIRAGGWHVCGQDTSGALECWGQNSDGELGRGTVFQRTGTAAPVSGLGPVRSYDLARIFTCAIDTSGAVLCWGGNPYGQLGDGTTTSRSSPTPVVPPP